MNDKFHERFNIAVDLDEAQRAFVNRAQNGIFFVLLQSFNERYINMLKLAAANALGEEYDHRTFSRYINGDFYK